MKNRAQKQKDLDALAEQFKGANAAMLVSFKNMTVAKDQELRRQLREAGVTYSVVKNTLARKAAAGTALEPMSDQFKGVTAVALSTTDSSASAMRSHIGIGCRGGGSIPRERSWGRISASIRTGTTM